MSSSTIEQPAVSDAGPSSSGSADGSPPDRSADSEHNAGAGSQGSESTADEGREGAGGEAPQASEVESLRAQVAAANARTAEHEKFLQTLLTPQGQEGAGEDPVRATVRQHFTESAQPGMEKFARELVEIAKRELAAEMGPQIGSLRQAVAGSAYERALGEKLDPDTIRSPEFKAFTKDMEGTIKSFRTLQKHDPDAAAQWAADRFRATSSGRAANAAERTRMQRAGTKLNSATPRGSGTQIPVLTVGANQEGKLSLMSAHLKQYGEGQDPADFYKKYVKQVPVT